MIQSYFFSWPSADIWGIPSPYPNLVYPVYPTKKINGRGGEVLFFFDDGFQKITVDITNSLQCFGVRHIDEFLTVQLARWPAFGLRPPVIPHHWHGVRRA